MTLERDARFGASPAPKRHGGLGAARSRCVFAPLQRPLAACAAAIGYSTEAHAQSPRLFAELAPDLEVYRFDEEHSIFRADETCSLRVGDKVQIRCNYTPFAIGYFGAYHVLEGGRVVDVWPVMPQGPESRWLLDMLERGD